MNVLASHIGEPYTRRHIFARPLYGSAADVLLSRRRETQEPQDAIRHTRQDAKPRGENTLQCKVIKRRLCDCDDAHTPGRSVKNTLSTHSAYPAGVTYLVQLEKCHQSEVEGTKRITYLIEVGEYDCGSGRRNSAERDSIWC